MVECYGTLRSIAGCYESVADRYGAITLRYGMVMENIDFAHMAKNALVRCMC